VEAKNYYEILGAAEDAAQDVIERLYKRIAKQHHPDRGGDEEDMKAIKVKASLRRGAAMVS